MQRLVILILLISVAASKPLVAQIARVFTGNLSGLTGVSVWVVDVSEDAVRDGLDTARVRVVVELALRSAGIPVYTLSDRIGMELDNPQFRSATLRIVINTLRHSYGIYAFNARLELLERLAYVDTGERVYGTIWETSGVGIVGVLEVGSGIVDTFREFAEEFANDYLTANPRNR